MLSWCSFLYLQVEEEWDSCWHAFRIFACIYVLLIYLEGWFVNKNCHSCFFLTRRLFFLPLPFHLSASCVLFLTLYHFLLLSSVLHPSNLQSRGVMKYELHWPLQKNTISSTRCQIMSAPATGSPNMEVRVVSQEMALLSNILAAYTFIAGKSNQKNCHVRSHCGHSCCAIRSRK